MAQRNPRTRDQATATERGWFDLSVESLDKHLPAGWKVQRMGDFSGVEKDGTIRLDAPDGTAYRLYASLAGFHMTAGVVGGAVVDLDSDGEPTVEGTRGVTETIPFEDALETIVRKAQEYAASDDKAAIRQRFERVMEQADQQRQRRVQSHEEGASA